LKRITRNIIVLFFLSCSYNSFSQEKELFDLIVVDDNATPPILPERMIFTQRILWGERGLMRKTGLVPLNYKNREKELRIRKSILKTQQILDYTTLAAMIAQVVVGEKYYNGDNSLHNTHKTINKVVNSGYFTGLALSLFSPPPIINKKTEGFRPKTNKLLSKIHFTAMILTNTIDNDNKKANMAATYTAFTSYAVAEIVFKF
tara:strand:- start:5067 stop:5675 length:609 start_codon:yes stop_codon:yes gene_type:complete